MLACSGWDETILVIDMQTGEEHIRLKGHKADVVDLMFSPDGKTLVSASWDRTARLWNVRIQAQRYKYCQVIAALSLVSPSVQMAKLS